MVGWLGLCGAGSGDDDVGTVRYECRCLDPFSRPTLQGRRGEDRGDTIGSEIKVITLSSINQSIRQSKY